MPRPSTAQISRTRWAILFSEQGGCCAGCFKRLDDDVHVDHVEPLARSGADRFENLQLMHARCNQQKGDLPALTWFARQRRWLLAETAQIRRRQMLVTIDPEVVARLRMIAKRARRPVSELIEEGARHVIERSAWRALKRLPSPAPWADAPPPGDHPDLFCRSVVTQ